MGNENGRILSPEELRLREINKMDQEMKMKFEKKSVKYNLKVVIKGDRNTGKTNLFRRLQGLGYQEGYEPTPEIQVGHINWDYKATNDVVKVEVWDVVDKAKKKSKGGLKTTLDESDEDEEEQDLKLPPQGSVGSGSYTVSNLDAKTVNVYKGKIFNEFKDEWKGTHAVIIMMDPLKKWTFDYAKREIDSAPEGIDILLVANCRDMGDHRVVKQAEIEDFVKYHDNKRLKYIEASMKNCYGLKGIVAFFNLPFLRLQREYIEAQLKQNDQEIENTEKEFELISSESNYNEYVKFLEETKKNKKQGSRLTMSTSAVNASTPPTQQPMQLTTSASFDKQAAPVRSQSVESQMSPKVAPAPVQAPKQQVQTPPVVAQPPPQPQAQPQASKPVEKKSLFSKFISAVTDSKPNNPEASKPKSDPKQAVDALLSLKKKGGAASANLDDFKADGDLGEDFFSDVDSSRNKSGTSKPELVFGNDEEEEDKPNSLVARAEDEEEEEEEEEPPKPVPVKIANKASTPSAPKQPPNAEPAKPEPPKPVASPTKVAPQPAPVSQPPKQAPVTQQRPTSPKTVAKPVVAEDSDEEAPNPLVAKAEDEDEEEEEPPKPAPVKTASKIPAKATTKYASMDSDDDKGNPMVSRDEDLDFREEEPPKKAAKSAPPQKAAVKPIITSEEDSDEDKPNPFVTSTEEEDPFAEPKPKAPVASKSKMTKPTKSASSSSGKSRKPKPNETPEEREERKRRHREKKQREKKNNKSNDDDFYEDF